jgi:hypothetical protein
MTSPAFVAAHAPAADAATVLVRTVPPLPGVTIVRGQREFVTGSRGTVKVTGFGGEVSTLKVPPAVVGPGVVARPDRWYGKERLGGIDGRVALSLNLSYRVALRFVDLQGTPIDPGLIDRVRLKSRTGIGMSVDPDRPVWLFGTRTVPFGRRLETKQIDWSIEGASVHGMNVVNRAQQRFVPVRQRRKTVRLLFYSARFTARDALFRFPMGTGIRLWFPNGRLERHNLGAGGAVKLSSLPRGDYKVAVDGPGFSFTRPVSISRNQEVDLQVLSYLDLGVVALLMLGILVGLALARRPRTRDRLATAVVALPTAAVWSIPGPRARSGAPAHRPGPARVIDLYPEIDAVDLLESGPGPPTPAELERVG